MIEDELDGMTPTRDKTIQLLGHVHATLPDLSLEDFDDVDVAGAHDFFVEFPWREHRDETATRTRLKVEWIHASVSFAIDSFFIEITATDRDYLFEVKLCLPSSTKFLGIFRYTRWYEFMRARKSDVHELITLFFDPSQDRRRTGIEDFAKKYAAALGLG